MRSARNGIDHARTRTSRLPGLERPIECSERRSYPRALAYSLARIRWNDSDLQPKLVRPQRRLDRPCSRIADLKTFFYGWGGGFMSKRHHQESARWLYLPCPEEPVLQGIHTGHGKRQETVRGCRGPCSSVFPRRTVSAIGCCSTYAVNKESAVIDGVTELPSIGEASGGETGSILLNIEEKVLCRTITNLFVTPGPQPQAAGGQVPPAVLPDPILTGAVFASPLKAKYGCVSIIIRSAPGMKLAHCDKPKA
jgi:hypothetical protein